LQESRSISSGVERLAYIAGIATTVLVTPTSALTECAAGQWLAESEC
jgi:hypothetical protein